MANNLEATIHWYDANATEYSKNVARLAQIYQINEFKDLVVPGGRVLDAGSGPGRDTEILNDKGLIVEGVDMSGGLVSVARKSYPNLKFSKGDIRKLDFENDAFDGVWANASLLHLDTVGDVVSSLGEFNRVLKHGGVLHVLVKAQTGSNKFEIVGDKLSGGHPRSFQYFTANEISDLIKDAGFQIVEDEQYKEVDREPSGRPGVEWIRVLAKKIN